MRFWPRFFGARPTELEEIPYRYFALRPARRGGEDDTDEAGKEELLEGTNFEVLYEYAPQGGIYF